MIVILIMVMMKNIIFFVEVLKVIFYHGDNDNDNDEKHNVYFCSINNYLLPK